MSDTTSVQAPVTTKWWGNSLTIRGALLSAASAAFPVLGAVVGIDLSGETIRQLGEQTVVLVQAAGGLAGMAMTIAGRLRASTRLERRSFAVQV